MAWWGNDLARYAFSSENPTWGDVGVIPFVVVLRMLVAAWVIWSVIRLDGRTLLRVLLAAFGVSFFLLYGWYYLILGRDDWGFVYWVVGGDLLYLVAGMMVGSAVYVLEGSTRPTNDIP